jgi:hypothetical protein
VFLRLPLVGCEYRRAWLAADATAGVTLAAYLLPAVMGHASVANLPPESRSLRVLIRRGFLDLLRLPVHLGHGHFVRVMQLWQHDQSEFVVALAAFVGVLSFGLLRKPVTEN